MAGLKSALAIMFFGLFLISFKTKHKPVPYSFPVINYFPQMRMPANNPATQEGVELGRYLFYDPILSKDSSFSCASCHKQNYAFSDAPNRFSKGLRNDLAIRNTPPLFNLAWHPGLFWDGRAANIEEQVFHPVRTGTEMDANWSEVEKRINRSGFYRKKFSAAFAHEKIDSVLISKAIAQFLRTLISHDSKFDSVMRGEAEYTREEFEGYTLVNNQLKGNCQQCHITDGDGLTTTLAFSNNGLDSVIIPENYLDKGRGAVTGQLRDYGKFKVPSLRNLAFTAPYMHDGRFNTLAEVVDFYSEGVHNSINIDSKMANVSKRGMHLTDPEKQKVIAFLKTMTDSSFVTNPAFGNPFLRQ